MCFLRNSVLWLSHVSIGPITEGVPVGTIVLRVGTIAKLVGELILAGSHRPTVCGNEN